MNVFQPFDTTYTKMFKRDTTMQYFVACMLAEALIGLITNMRRVVAFLATPGEAGNFDVPFSVTPGLDPANWI